MTPRLLHILFGIAILSASQTAIAADECSANAEYNYQTANYTVFFHNTSTSSGDSNEWHWDFGDGNASVLTDPIHSYSNYGTYHCCLTINSTSADGPCADTYCLDVIVIEGGLCSVETSFEIEELENGQAMFIPSCETLGNTEIDEFSWDFQGETLEEDSPVWQFDNTEELEVCLTTYAHSPSSQCSDTKCEEVVIDNFVCELGADFKVYYTECGIGLSYKFEQLGLYTEATELTWTFSDGTQMTGFDAEHTFSESGVYEICLSVVGNCPSSDCMSEQCISVEIVCPEEEDRPLPDLAHGEEVKGDDELALNVQEKPNTAISVYPNPTVDFLNIKSAEGINTVSAWNLAGQQVLLETASGARQHSVDVSGLSNGHYVYHVELINGQVVTGQMTKF